MKVVAIVFKFVEQLQIQTLGDHTLKTMCYKIDFANLDSDHVHLSARKNKTRF